jgi:hypothetical protein
MLETLHNFDTRFNKNKTILIIEITSNGYDPKKGGV